MLTLILLVGLFGSLASCEQQGRIVGGQKAPKMYPYQISLQMARNSSGGGGGFLSFLQRPQRNNSHFCGGSIMNENYIVTAAHCVSGFPIERMSILAGTANLQKESIGQRRQIDNCVIHPEYVELNNSDIAVCKLKEPLTFNENVSSTTIGREYVGGGVECLLTGWGYTTMVRGFPLPNDLQQAELPTLTNEDCNSKGHNVGPREICTLSRAFQGACGGDSGGPLICNDNLVGVVSYGTMICAVSMPDVFTRASEYADWVDEQMGGGGSSSESSTIPSSPMMSSTETATS